MLYDEKKKNLPKQQFVETNYKQSNGPTLGV